MTLEILREFFFWNMVINMGLLMFSLVITLAARKWIYKMHGSIFKLTDTQFDAIWYSIFGAYKIAIFMLNVVPYIALRIMT